MRAWLLESSWEPLVRAAARCRLPPLLRLVMQEAPYLAYVLDDGVEVTIAGADVTAVIGTALSAIHGVRCDWVMCASDEASAVAMRALGNASQVVGIGRA